MGTNSTTSQKTLIIVEKFLGNRKHRNNFALFSNLMQVSIGETFSLKKAPPPLLYLFVLPPFFPPFRNPASVRASPPSSLAPTDWTQFVMRLRVRKDTDLIDGPSAWLGSSSSGPRNISHPPLQHTRNGMEGGIRRPITQQTSLPTKKE